MINDHQVPRRILPAIVCSQFCCTSLWFAGNAVLPDIARSLVPDAATLANITSAVQFGFITGTLLFAMLAIADRWSPSRVFFCCAIIAAALNLGMTTGLGLGGLLAIRFFTGFFLAGIYPVGMKIAADYYRKELGKSLGFLVGALVLGTAFPHFLKSITTALPWKYVLYVLSALAAAGGLAMLLIVPDGPYRKSGQALQPTAFLSGFHSSRFRAVSFGYFGHMWELYAFWAFVPVMLATHKSHYHTGLNVPLWSFLVIASGSIACIGSGLLSQRWSPRKIATLSLFLSGCCCLLSPLLLWSGSVTVLLCFLFFWGMVVIADSPMFSTLVAQNVPEMARGTSLTIVNCIGFSITIVSIQCIRLLSGTAGERLLYLALAAGPVIGLMALRGNKEPPTI